ncbi:MAG: LON peptidase substrate-binding domain-containing protein [Bernardetiaceae bacterium]|nr:LON peptidase substrate-binding domain-containing protein [Bernardetiaceae bacterium]
MILPFFPLNMVVFPNEAINLHVFEPRYKQLIHECDTEKKTFGIPTFMDDKIQEYGAELKLLEISKKYPDGRMDIKAEGQRIIKVKTWENPVKGRLYAGGEVELITPTDHASLSEKMLLLEKIRELYEVVNVEVEVEADEPFLTYIFAHKLGLSQEEEYEMLKLKDESQRISFLQRHLSKAIPTVREIERIKARIRMNGHFQRLDPLDF